MSNIVRTWEDEALPAGEIELTDAQLAAVYGAWSDDCDNCHDHDVCHEKHFKFKKSVHIHFEFDFDLEIKKDEFKKDCDW